MSLLSIFQELNSYADHAESTVNRMFPNTVAKLREYKEKLEDEYYNPQNYDQGLELVLKEIQDFLSKVDSQKEQET